MGNPRPRATWRIMTLIVVVMFFSALMTTGLYLASEVWTLQGRLGSAEHLAAVRPAGRPCGPSLPILTTEIPFGRTQTSISVAGRLAAALESTQLRIASAQRAAHHAEHALMDARFWLHGGVKVRVIPRTRHARRPNPAPVPAARWRAH